MIGRRFACVVFLTSALGGAGVGCASLFPGIQTGNTVADLSAFVTVASNVSAWASDAWAFIPPLIQQAGQAAYTDAQNGLKTLIEEAQDAIAVYQAGQGTPNWLALISGVTQAADALVAEVESLMNSPASSGVGKIVPTPQFTGRLTQLKSAQATLHRFKNP